MFVKISARKTQQSAQSQNIIRLGCSFLSFLIKVCWNEAGKSATSLQCHENTNCFHVTTLKRERGRTKIETLKRLSIKTQSLILFRNILLPLISMLLKYVISQMTDTADMSISIS